MSEHRWLCEHLERAPRRLSAAREVDLRDYPRHYDAGDTVHELLSEIDWLRAEVERLRSSSAVMNAAERMLREACPRSGYVEVNLHGETFASISDCYSGETKAEGCNLAEAYACLVGGEHG